MPLRQAAAYLAAACVVLGVSPASAFRTIEDYPDVPEGARVAWPNGEFEYWIHDEGIDSIDAATLSQMSERALLAWASAPCSRLLLRNHGITPLPAEPDDGMNTIQFIEEDWEDLGYPEDAAGAADVLFGELDDGTWAILEADIYINAEHHRWSAATVPGDGQRSLLGVLTHEAGHALGLLHPCEPEGADDAPACDADEAPGDLMSPYYGPDQAHPEEDDYAGICYLYPGCGEEGCAEGFRCEAQRCVAEDGSDAECPAGSAGEGGEACDAERPTGAECSESNQCEGGECVAGVEVVPICTVRCGAGLPECPVNWACTSVEDRQVCIPPNPEGGCGCVLHKAQRSSRRHGSLPELLFVAGIGFASLLRFARTRRLNRREITSPRAASSRGAPQKENQP